MQHIKFGRGNFNKQFHMLLFPYGRFPEIQPLTCMDDLRRLSAQLTTNLLYPRGRRPGICSTTHG